MTNQVMFDRAVRGLASQRWQLCMTRGGSCVYSHEGMHCAWGWVDPEGTAKACGVVRNLWATEVGLAATLDGDQLLFATDLQIAHDNSSGGEDMRFRFSQLADKYSLTWPEDVA
jgi:hypothetical protein